MSPALAVSLPTIGHVQTSRPNYFLGKVLSSPCSQQLRGTSHTRNGHMSTGKFHSSRILWSPCSPKPPSQTGSKRKCPFLLPTVPIPEPVDAVLVSGWENQARETGSIRVFLDFHLQHPLPPCRLQNATWTRSVMSPSVSGCHLLHAIPNSSSEWLGPCLLCYKCGSQLSPFTP